MSKFKVLWIDDQTQKCKRDAKSVERTIESLGFEPDISFNDNISKNSLNDSDGVLNKAIRARNTDLFIIDYNLKNDVFGSDIIQEIRKNNNIYTDIIFYSSDAKALIDAVKSSFDSSSVMDFCDGVYVVPLEDSFQFQLKVQYVITKIIKSWYNVHSIRGIILSKASKFEQAVSEIISQNYRSCLSTIKEELNKKGINTTTSICGKWKKVNEIDDPIPYILNDSINFNWTVKKLILKILVDKNIVAIPSWEYMEYIFRLRNDFAHNPIHLPDGKLILTKNGEEISYDESDIEDIRNKLNLVEKELMSLTLRRDNGCLSNVEVEKSLALCD